MSAVDYQITFATRGFNFLGLFGAWRARIHGPGNFGFWIFQLGPWAWHT